MARPRKKNPNNRGTVAGRYFGEAIELAVSRVADAARVSKSEVYRTLLTGYSDDPENPDQLSEDLVRAFAAIRRRRMDRMTRELDAQA